MIEISDEQMRAWIGGAKAYSIVILRRTPSYATVPGGDKIVWEHVRRNFALRAAGDLAIVCPISDGTPVCGLGIFTTDPQRTDEIMRGDPGVQAGIFEYEVHASRSFPGDALT